VKPKARPTPDPFEHFTILDAMDDPALFAPWFSRSPASWAAWRVFLSELFGLPSSCSDRRLAERHTGRTAAPSSSFSEAWLICGRRAGKSFILALIAVYLACFRDYSRFLAPGERGTIVIIAVDRRQARTIFRYISALLLDVPLLRKLVQRSTQDSFDLANGVTIEIHAASFRGVRGYTIIAALLDELAFFPVDEFAANPDVEIIDALRPAMSTIPGAMLLCASSPYARRGALWDAFRRYYGRADAPILVWRADTRSMNPTVPQRVIDGAYDRDPARAAAEYGAEFRSDVETFVSRDAVDAVVPSGLFERPPTHVVSQYFAFVDPSGGSSDSMTIAIAHKDLDGSAVLDAIREVRAPFSPDAVVADFAALCRAYRVGRVYGDRYGGE
jgi:hypothetical protein